MSLALPGANTGTDGRLLTDHALHAIVLDMITRTQTVWPRYGTSPGYEQAGPGGHGFQEICTSSLATALEWGMFEYAEGVLENYLEYFVRSRGRVLCKYESNFATFDLWKLSDRLLCWQTVGWRCHSSAGCWSSPRITTFTPGTRRSSSGTRAS